MFKAAWIIGSGIMEVRLTATPKGNGFEATITLSNGVSINSAEAFPSEAEAILAAAEKLLQMPDRLERMEKEERELSDLGSPPP